MQNYLILKIEIAVKFPLQENIRTSVAATSKTFDASYEKVDSSSNQIKPTSKLLLNLFGEEYTRETKISYYIILMILKEEIV